MAKHIYSIASILLAVSVSCPADTFKHRQTGEIFHGFATQKTIGSRTRVYIAEQEHFKPVVLAEYEVTPDPQGRGNHVFIIPLNSWTHLNCSS